MKKTLILLPIVAILAACGTTDQYAKRAEAEYSRQTDEKKQSIKQTPSWYKDKAQTSASAVFAYGVGESKDRKHAEFLAKNLAYADICMSAGGAVTKRGKVFQTGDATVSELVIISACNKTDITGIEISKKEEFVVGNRYQTYVEIALPTGEANVQRRGKEEQRLKELSVQRAPQAFKEAEQQ